MILTPKQAARIAKASADADSVKVWTADEASDGYETGDVGYQLHYSDGTFGARVQVHVDGELAPSSRWTAAQGWNPQW